MAETLDPKRANVSSPYKILFLFTGLMLVMPLFMYFFSKSFIFDGVLQLDGNNSSFYAAMVAVVTVHIVLGLFVWKAFTEESTPTATLLGGVKRD